MRKSHRLLAVGCLLFLFGFVSEGNSVASLISVGPSAFPGSSTLINFNGLASGIEVNGLTVGGVHFTYTIGGSPVNGAVQIDGGPGTTNNISPPNIVSVGNNTGTLTISLPSPESLFGYGFAILATSTVPTATTISVFSGATLLGSLSYPGIPDPIFTGGFAGVASTTAFDSVAVTFNSTQAPAFALDNIIFANTPVPEPSTLLLAVLGCGVLLWRGRLNRA